MDFFRRQDWDIVGKAWLWLGISAVLIIFGMVWWAMHGLNLGIDFTGGELLRYQLERPLSGARAEETEVLRQVRNLLKRDNLGKSQIQISGTNQIFIRIPELEIEEAGGEQQSQVLEQKVHSGLGDLLADKYGKVTIIGREKVGPIVGKQLRDKALLALILGCALILIYITIRYEFRFAVAGIASLIHDVLIVLAAMAVLQVELDSSFVAAILTVIGYSINDTVVIFDRIRENRKLRRGAPFDQVVNASLLQTMSRSINTTGTTLFTLIALYGWGGTTIRGFALALIVGIATGAYSSVFTASPIVVLWHRRAAREPSAAARSARPSAARRREPAAEADTADAEQPPEEEREDAGAEKVSARETIRQAEAKAREEKRETRRSRRKKKKSTGRKKRY